MVGKDFYHVKIPIKNPIYFKCMSTEAAQVSSMINYLNYSKTKRVQT